MAAADELLAPDYRRYISPTTAPLSVDVQKQRLAGIRAAFPDWHLTVEDMIADGDRVAFRATIRGTHKGTFQSIVPTGKPVTVSALDIVMGMTLLPRILPVSRVRGRPFRDPRGVPQC